MRKTNGLILMTALVPTVGHDFLVNFGSQFIDGDLHVIISSRSFEPVPGSIRVTYFRTTTEHNVVVHHHYDDDAPQTPESENDTAFWLYWKNIIGHYTRYQHIDYVFASEPYGQKVADSIGAEFIPVDIERSTFPVKGSSVRADLFANSDSISPKIRAMLRRNVVLFGPESCGKTTMAKKLAKDMNGTFVSEWARPYLEYVGGDLTEHQMQMIVKGQVAQERSAELISSKMLIVKDTNILSTLGFYRLWGITQPPGLEKLALIKRGELYIVMNDGIPFEKDPLRYGGDKRESAREYWIDLLKEFNREYIVVQSTNHDEQLEEIKDAIMSHKQHGMVLNDIQNFVRD